MQTQNLSNHVKTHPLFHYFIVPVSLLLVATSLLNIFLAFSLAAIIIFVATVLLHLIAFIARSYAKKNQDRIIRTEMRLRYYLLTGKSFESIEQKLSFSLLTALRFAPDDELIGLLSNPAIDKMTAAEIKQQIKNWNPDYMRV